jgi:hypothetical protein
MGRGGSYTATATGYNSFFYNPAGFARAGELTLASTNLWVFMDRDMVALAQQMLGAFGITRSAARALDPAALEGLTTYFEDLADWAADEDPAVLEQILQTATGDAGLTIDSEDDLADIIAAAGTEDIVAFLEAFDAAAESLATSPLWDDDLIDNLLAEAAAALPKGYVRVGGQVGLGYLGNGIGLGLFANAEAVLDGTNILAAYGTAYNTITFVAGLGLSFGNLHVGLSMRPTVFGYSRINAAPIVTSYFTGGSIDLLTVFANSVYYGSGLGIDLGAVWELGPLSLGLALKDVFGTHINYRSSSIEEYFAALRTASLPAGTDLSDEEQANAWTIPMKVNLGVEFHPNLGVTSYLFDPSVSVDLLDVTSTLRTISSGGEVTGDQVLAMFNFGGQIDLFRFLSVRAGYAGGYLSAGLGLDLFFLDINAAIAGDFGRDQAGTWGFSNIGGSVEVALRL